MSDKWNTWPTLSDILRAIAKEKTEMGDLSTPRYVCQAADILERLMDDDLFHIIAGEHGGLIGRVIRGMRAYRKAVRGE